MALPQKKRKFNGSYILTVMFFIMVGVFFVSFFNLKAEVTDKQAAVNKVSEDYLLQSEENDELERMLKENDIEEYVEKRARDEDLGYVMPNERVYYDLVTSGE